jgi:hypothetical protein
MSAHFPPRSAIRARSSLAAALLLATFVPPRPALAHVGPEVLRLLWRSGGDGLVMLTNRGLLFGDTADRNFRLMCIESLGLSQSERPDLALLPDGGVMLATSAGVGVTRDEGCSWQGVTPFANAMSPALAQDPGKPETLYLATFTPSEAGGLHVSRDAGERWTRLLATEADDFVQELRIAPSDSTRIYAAGQVFAEDQPTMHYVARSTDAGESWDRFELPAAETEIDIALLAVSPADPGILLAATKTQDPLVTPERLLISRDGGETFRTAFETQLIHDASFGSDGSTIWVAGSMGLWRSTEEARRFEKLQGPLYTSCVDEHDGMLWSCGLFAPDHDGVGTRASGASGFEAAMLLTDVQAPVACESSSPTATRCAGPWQQWEREVRALAMAGGPGGAGGKGRQPQAGSTGTAGATAAESSRESEGCGALGTARAPSLCPFAAGLAVAWAWVRRRTRALRPPS